MMQVAATPGSAHLSRRWSVRLTRAYGAPERATRVVELLTSEVVTNAIKYGQVTGSIELSMHYSGNVVEVSVTDENPAPPVILAPHKLQVGGRGMQLVQRLAHRWGSEPTDRGKRVWFQVALA
ncbi:ATP-binding protein [Cellulomonas sp. 179-A 4D5 NHS]|uniref:ATP-binding protein n=1 Tax=Cellulomonas sp. 179-A 4D5 NHS TaxID=3142378 RepID=UPI0039A1512E